MLAFLLLLALADEQSVAMRVAGDSIQWVAPMVDLPAGSKIALLEGFPGLPMPFTVRVQLPSQRTIGPYSAKGGERITVLSGRVRLTTPPQSPAVYGPGSFFYIPASIRHTVEAVDDAVLQVSSIGPWPSPPGSGGPSPDSTVPTKAEGMSLEIASIQPPSNAIVDRQAVVHVTVRYSIGDRQPEDYVIVPMVQLTMGATRSPAGSKAIALERPSGTLSFDIPLLDPINDRLVRKPIRLWFFLNRKTGDNRSTPELRTPTIEYIAQ